MAKKKFFLIVDTETTQTGKVADFGAVVVDKQGVIHREMGILVGDFFADKTNHPLFHIYGDKNDVFSKASLPARYERYEQMLSNGERYLASRDAVNRWLAKVAAAYPNITATAYNIAFDREKLSNSGIIFNELFPNQFCLWHAAVAKWGNTRAFREYVLNSHHFGARTKKGNMTMKTNAEAMAAFITGIESAEPHTALEDARDFERPILAALVKNTSPQVYMNPPPYNWRHWQVKDHFTAK